MITDETVGRATAELLLANIDDIAAAWSTSPLFASRDGREQSTADCTMLISAMAEAVRAGQAHDPASPTWTAIRPIVAELGAQAAPQVDQTTMATRIEQLKAPLLALLTGSSIDGGTAVNTAVAAATLSTAVDTVRQLMLEHRLRTGSGIIALQQEQLMELSTPVIKLWDAILAIPLVGTLDSVRSQSAMENLLNAIVEHSAEVAILDITGVPTVDTMVAQHLLKTVMAARLMGTTCIISGIRPQIAQTMVQLGIDLGEVITRATLADAFRFALGRIGHVVQPRDLG